MLIGLSGKAGTGKTTVAGKLILAGGRRVSFADALRAEVAFHFGAPWDLLSSRAAKDGWMIRVGWRDMTVRGLLQWWGSLRRQGDPDYWIRQTLEGVGEGLTVIDDVRYKNEAEAVKSAGGLIFRLEPYPEWHPPTGATHLSETDLDDWEHFDGVFHPGYGLLDDTVYKIREVMSGD